MSCITGVRLSRHRHHGWARNLLRHRRRDWAS